MTAERLVSMCVEKIMILFFGLFLGFLFYPLLITPFPKVPLNRELKILGIEDAWRWGGHSLSESIYQGWCWCILSPRCPSTALRLQISSSLSSWEILDQGLAYFALFSLPQVVFFHIIFAFLHFSSFKWFLSVSQPPEEGRTCWRNLGKVRSEFVVEEISKWELLVSDLTGFFYILLDPEEMSLAGVFCK